MSWEVVSCWIESHPGLASWVQAVGSVIALLFAVLLPYFGRRADRKQAEDNRAALMFVLFTDAELIVDSCNSKNDIAQARVRLDAYLPRLNAFLGGENSLLTARSALRIRSEIEKFRIALDAGWSDFLLKNSKQPLQTALLKEARIFHETHHHLLKSLRQNKAKK